MIKKIYSFIIIFLSLFLSTIAKAQSPLNNAQCKAQSLVTGPTGLLPAAPPCASSGGFTTGNPVSVSGTLTGATNDSLSGAITSCYAGANGPLKDVWYWFTASETHVEISLSSSGLSDPYVAIYESSNGECVGLIPRDCFSATGTGTYTMSFGPLTYGVKYYLQVASTKNLGSGAFNMVVNSKNICSDCLKNSLLNCYPLPVQAAYPPDTTVGFCYSVIGYKEQYGNRLHGVVPVFGNGWDVSTLKIVSVADSADLKGEWKYFKNITVNGSTVDGFFYDADKDGNPTNNLGDDGTIATVWTFCFTIKTKNKAACDAGQKDLNIEFNTYSDGESGSLTSIKDCSADKEYMLKAHMNCCPKPLIVLNSKTTCDKSADGKITAYGGSPLFSYTYQLYNNAGTVIDKKTIPAGLTPYTNNTLNEGNYYLYILDGAGCYTAMNIYIPGPISYTIQQTSFGCGTGCSNSAKVSLIDGLVSSFKWNNGTTGATPSNLCAGWNYDTMRVASSACKIVDSIFIFNLPFGNAGFRYGKRTYCTSDAYATVFNYPATTGGTFSIASDSTDGKGTIDPSNGTLNLTGIQTITTSGRIIVKYVTGPPCNTTTSDTIFIKMSPPPVSIYTDQNLCFGMPNPLFTNTSAYFIKWYSDSALTIPKTTQNPASSPYDPFGGTSPIIGTPYTFYLTQMISSTSVCQSTPIALRITVHPKPIVDAGISQTICPGFGANLIATGANSYSWQPAGLLNSSIVASPIASPTVTTSFTVTGTELSGCSSIDTVTIYVSSNGKCSVKIYNGFTPNGDNHNDYWYIDGIAADEKNEVTIFNRWGEKLWETTGYDNLTHKWEGQGPSGKILPDGTYYYVIHFKNEILKGWVELTK